MNIIEHSDDEIAAIAHPMWEELIKYSNEGEYGKFIRKFSYEMLFGLNEVEIGKQFAKSELTRSLDPNYEFIGFIRRGEHVTCLYRMRAAPKEKANGWVAWSLVITRKKRSISTALLFSNATRYFNHTRSFNIKTYTRS